MSRQTTLVERIDQCFFGLTSSQKTAAEYIKATPDAVAFCTANELSKRIGVSESTIVRLARSLNYASYVEMQREIRSGLRKNGMEIPFSERLKAFKEDRQDNILESTIKSDIENSLNLLNESFQADFDAAVLKLRDAEKLYVCGNRSSGFIAEYLAYFMDFIRPGVISMPSGGERMADQLIDCGAGDVFFVIGMSRYSVSTIETTKLAKKRGAFVIGITDSNLSPIAELSDICLACGTKLPLFWSSGSVLSVINAMLKAAALREDGRRSERMERMEALLDEANVFYHETGTRRRTAARKNSDTDEPNSEEESMQGGGE